MPPGADAEEVPVRRGPSLDSTFFETAATFEVLDKPTKPKSSLAEKRFFAAVRKQSDFGAAAVSIDGDDDGDDDDDGRGGLAEVRAELAGDSGMEDKSTPAGDESCIALILVVAVEG